MHPPPPPAAILFDMDGVLVDSTAAHERAWTRWLEAWGLAPPAGGVRSLFGRPGAEALADLLDRPPEDARTRAALAELEGYADEELAGRPPQELLIPGAADLVARLADAGWRLAVATSARRRVAQRALAPLEHALTALVTADDVARGKPDPEIYRAAAARLGVSPSASIVVEDAVVGVLAGKGAGARVIGVPTTATAAALRAAGADDVVAELAELPRVLPRHPAGVGDGS